MLSTGDVHGGLRRLETFLRAIKYPGHVDYDGLSKGDPLAFLPIVSYTLNSFSPPFAEQLMATGHELTGKTDLRFTDTLYKVLRDIFHYKPILTKQQFLQWGFSQRKISVVCDIISMVLQKHNQLKKPRVRCPASNKEVRGEAHPAQTDSDLLCKKPFIVNHIENPSTFHTNTSAETLSSNAPGNGIREFAAGEEDKENTDHLSEVKGRLSALEVQMESLQSGLHRISVLERRLEEVERWKDSEQNKGDVITISRENWENLQSRVLLLETKLELSNTQSYAPLACPSSVSSTSSSTTSDAPKEELRDRLQRISQMLKSTSTLLKNTDSTPTSCT